MILNIETTTTNCSVSLSEAGEIIALKEENNTNYSHSESLHVFIDTLLKEANVNKHDLSAIAVSQGPGSYTGLRIGVSSSKGLCYALDLPLITVSTLQTLALQVNVEQGYIIPMLDARRNEVYSSIFNSKHENIRYEKAEILSPSSFEEYLKKDKVYFVGNANDKTRKILNSKHGIFLKPTLPSSREMTSLSYKKYKDGDFADVAYFEPMYLKQFMGSIPKSTSTH